MTLADSPTNSTYYESPIGVIEISGTSKAVTSLHFVDSVGQTHSNDCLDKCVQELDEYFQGKRSTFTVPFNTQGTDFQNHVWQALTEIPYGKTASYGDIAAAIYHPNAMRAVGNANNKNQLPLLIPCHRVIGTNGKLTGYAGGLWRKEWLLDHERKTAQYA